MSNFNPIDPATLDKAIRASQKAEHDRAAQRAAAEARKAVQAIDERLRRETGGRIGLTGKTFTHKARGKQAASWPSALTEMLLRDRSMCSRSNDDLMRAVCAALGVEPYRGQKMSEALTARQRQYVQPLLLRVGITGTFSTMTQVKHLIRDHGKKARQSKTVERTNQSTTFNVDGVAWDGEHAMYVQRRAKPTGDPLRDTCIRIDGLFIPLFAFAKIRSISVEEANAAMAAAVTQAAEEQAAQKAAEEQEQMAERLGDLDF